MKFTNVKKTVLTGSVNLPAVVQAAEVDFTGEEAGKLYLAGQLYTGAALKNGKLYNYKAGVQGAAYTGTFTGKYLNVSTGTQAQIRCYRQKVLCKGSVTEQIYRLEESWRKDLLLYKRCCSGKRI